MYVCQYHKCSLGGWIHERRQKTNWTLTAVFLQETFLDVETEKWKAGKASVCFQYEDRRTREKLAQLSSTIPYLSDPIKRQNRNPTNFYYLVFFFFHFIFLAGNEIINCAPNVRAAACKRRTHNPHSRLYEKYCVHFAPHTPLARIYSLANTYRWKKNAEFTVGAIASVMRCR
jgi:hypothetical protein